MAKLQHTLRFSGMPITMVQVSKLYDDLFLTKHILGQNIIFLCIYLSKLHAPWGFQACQSQWYKFQSCMMICFWQNTFWDKTSLLFVFRGWNSMHPEVFRHANHNGTSFKAVWWWSVLGQNTFWDKTSLSSLYLEGQTPCTLRFSGMPITMVQVSKLYDDLFLTKHILG